MTHRIKPPSPTTAYLVTILAATACGTGTGDTAQTEDQTGQVTVALTSTPAANTCLVLAFTGATTATTYTGFATAGSSTAALAVKLAIGTVNVTPLAYTTATCTSSGVSALNPTWFGPSVTVNVLPGLPTQIPVTLHPYNVTTSVDFSQGVKEIAAGYATTYALLADGTVRAWGYNAQGQLGNNTTNNVANPTPVTVANGTMGTVTALASGSGAKHMCALNNASSGNNAYCWGFSTYCQLGNASSVNSPVPVAVSGTNLYSAISVASHSTYAINRSNGSIWVWGSNSSGQLGNGTLIDSCTPTSTGSIAEQVAAGEMRIMARSGSTVWGAGYNARGQLGSGDTTSSLYLLTTHFASGLWPVYVAAGKSHSCVAVSPSGAVQCAGFNEYGQLGDGTTTNRVNPVSVSGLAGVVAVAAGNSHSCGLKYDGTIWCWGANGSGALGDGTSSTRLTPVQVVGINDAKAIVASGMFTCALRSDATMWCWGENAYGQLGDGTTIPRAVPTKVLIQ